MKLKKLIATALCATAVLSSCAFASCGEKKQELIVYTEAGFAPWEFTAKGSTDIIGVDMEIAKYIANKYDYTLKVVDGSFDTIVAGIAEDNALGIAGISYNTTRAEAVEYSDFYWADAYQAVVYLKDANPTLTTDGAFATSNFTGKKVVYQTGTTSQLTITENETAWGITGKKDYADVLVAFQDVTADTAKGTYLIVDSQVAAQIAAENTNCAYAAIEGLEPEQYGVVAKKGNTALIEKVNAALKELLEKDANGKNQIEKWFDEYSAIEPEE
ncbi:MAG: transporter substrate-binding domain-containing protein [Clostridia bacterium]|nr:transporter substrate-binding domain-containing protein [Clostridia bacterium]